MDKDKESQIFKPFKEQASHCSSNKACNNDSSEGKEFLKYSSFLIEEKICNFELPTRPNRKRQYDEDLEEYSKINHDKKSKSSSSPQSIDEGSSSTGFDEDKDFSNCTTPNRSQFSSQINPTTSMNRNVTLQCSNYPTVPFLKSPDLGQRKDYSHYQPHNRHIREDSFTKGFFSTMKPPGVFPYFRDDSEGRNEDLGSELLIAAYNNFVRKVVDETLDRTITFCEQPRNAISALERICTKAWPQLEAKRHRNRIRAYLKACRRNSKKNCGQINMKEPPMNALSAEARQIVASALHLVRKDIEQLREDLKRDNSPSVFTAKNGTLPPNLRSSEAFSNNSSHHRGSSATVANFSLQSNLKPSIFTPMHSISKSSTEKSIQNTPTWLDPQYFSALMHFLSASLQVNKELGVNFSSTEKNGVFGETRHDSRDSRSNKRDGKAFEQQGSSLRCQTPPAAHFAIARCSPSLSQATSILLEVRPLSQDDLEYFQRYQGLMEEATEYVRGVSQMLLKKVEIIEGHIKESKSSCGINPLNCTTNCQS